MLKLKLKTYQGCQTEVTVLGMSFMTSRKGQSMSNVLDLASQSVKVDLSLNSRWTTNLPNKQGGWINLFQGNAIKELGCVLNYVYEKLDIDEHRRLYLRMLYIFTHNKESGQIKDYKYTPVIFWRGAFAGLLLRSWPLVDATHPQAAKVDIYFHIDKGHPLHDTMTKIYNTKTGYGTTAVQVVKNLLASNCYITQARLHFQRGKGKWVPCRRQSLWTSERRFLVHNQENGAIFISLLEPSSPTRPSWLSISQDPGWYGFGWLRRIISQRVWIYLFMDMLSHYCY